MLHWTVHLKGPGRDYDHADVAVGYKVYSFGIPDRETSVGNYRGPITVHVFNTVSLRWMKLPPVRSGRERLGVPSMRWGYTAVLIEDIIYIWGGGTSMGYCNALYGFDVHSHRWFKPKVSGSVPEERCGHSACVLGVVMYIFGGHKSLAEHCANHVHKFDTATMLWSQINAKGNPAPASDGHTATIIGTKMFVFGGQGDQWDHYNNIRAFDTEANCWLNTPYVQFLPEGRVYHSAFVYNQELYIFGGRLLNFTFNDLWKFNPDNFSWKKVQPKGKVPCSRMSSMGCCMVGSSIILFGGYKYTNIQDSKSEGDGEVSDLYILDLCPNLKMLCKLAVIQYGMRQSGLPHDVRWELSAMTTNINRKKSITLNECQRPSSRKWNRRKRKTRSPLSIQFGKKADRMNVLSRMHQE